MLRTLNQCIDETASSVPLRRRERLLDFLTEVQRHEEVMMPSSLPDTHRWFTPIVLARLVAWSTYPSVMSRVA